MAWVRIEIIKDFGRLKTGEVKSVGEETAKILIEKGIAKAEGEETPKPKRKRTTKRK